MQAQNVGIGNTNPAFRADVSGRLRIRGGADLNNSAGLWLSGIANESETNHTLVRVSTKQPRRQAGNIIAPLQSDINFG